MTRLCVVPTKPHGAPVRNGSCSVDSQRFFSSPLPPSVQSIYRHAVCSVRFSMPCTGRTFLGASWPRIVHRAWVYSSPSCSLPQPAPRPRGSYWPIHSEAILLCVSAAARCRWGRVLVEVVYSWFSPFPAIPAPPIRGRERNGNNNGKILDGYWHHKKPP